jgi:Zn-dependent protease with chaperone function
MNDLQAFYPANPLNVPDAVTEPSPAFKTEVKKVMGSISLFFIVYLILIALSVVLSIACVFLGIGLMGALTNFIGLAGGLGIISIGILVFVFLIKFIFSVKKFDTAGNIEITETEQPVLFSFIRKLTEDTQTQFPKKIVLSPDVNACVFYNDSFWSMLFPVKKNLQIGLGLVNTLTISEFKAVMAHEFGHFSQRSMKLGSFVYNVNKVIYNMLFENKNYSVFLRRWGNLHWAISIFVSITIQLVRGIQKILQGMYGFINKSYMSLSREMEFHADAVAASVSGGNNLITALQKVEVSDSCYNTVLQKANDMLKEKTVFENIYAKHQVVMVQYAKEYNLSLVNNTPVLNNDFYKNFQHSKINIKNQWASHPTREDRETHLEQLHINGVTDNRSAWMLFDKARELQKEITASLYKTVPAELQQQSINDQTFKERYLTDIDIYNFPAEYNGYYDNRLMNDMNIEKLFNEPSKAMVSKEEFEQLFSDEKTGLLKSVQANQQDAILLEAIANKQLDIKTFDYSGGKYKKEAAAGILEKLQKEITAQQQQVQENEEKIVSFFYAAAQLNSKEDEQLLKTTYLLYVDNKKKIDEHTAICHGVTDLLSPLVAGQTVSLQAAADMASGLRKESNSLRPLLIYWVEKGVFNSNIPLKEKAMKFCGVNYLYFSSDSFFDNELKHLNEIVNESMHDLSVFQFKKFKSLLEYQLQEYHKQVK